MGNSKPGKLIFSVSLAVLLGCAGAYWASGFDVGMLRLQSSDQQPKAMPHVIYPSSHR